MWWTMTTLNELLKPLKEMLEARNIKVEDGHTYSGNPCLLVGKYSITLLAEVYEHDAPGGGVPNYATNLDEIVKATISQETE